MEPELLGPKAVRLPRTRPEPEPEADPRDLWHVPWRRVVAVVLVVGAVSWAWNADQRERRHETASLAQCRSLLRDVTLFADQQAGSIAASGIARRDIVVERSSRPARARLPVAALADQVCRAVDVKPWHLSLTRQREAVTAYSSALDARLREIAADGPGYYSETPSLRELRRAADIVIGDVSLNTR